MVVGIPAKSATFSNFIALSLVGVWRKVNRGGVVRGWFVGGYSNICSKDVRMNCGDDGGA